ncbi:MAG: sulfatase [Planctomycetes bacterium]|nr:sulfatase [Planctomycetota bacterium]
MPDPGDGSRSRPPNIIMILADDLGWRDTSINGSTFYQTPSLARLAAAGTRFTNAYSASPLCSPTRASILTGQYPARLRLTLPNGHLDEVLLDPIVPSDVGSRPKLREPQTRTRLPDGLTTYAEILRGKGYATAFLGKWHLGEDPYLPENQGFDTVVGGRQHSGPPGGYFSPFTADSNLPPSAPGTHVNDLLVDSAIQFMKANRDRAFLMNLWFYDVHSPFRARPDLVEKYEGRLGIDDRQRCPTMGAMIETMDSGVGRLLDAIAALGLREQTAIIFYSDNGGNMYEWQDDALPTSNWPLRQGKSSIYEGGTRVPCVIVWPGQTLPGSVNTQLVSSVDLFPTILDMADAASAPGAVVDGVSLRPAIERLGATRHQTFCYMPHTIVPSANLPACSVRQGDWKLIRFFHDGGGFSHRYELYDLAVDPGERLDLADSRPDLVASLDGLITRHLADCDALVPLPNPDYRPIDTRWVPLSQCMVRPIANALQVTSNGFSPTIVPEEDLSVMGPPAVLEMLARSRSAGPGAVAWRYPEQSDFEPGQSTAFAVIHDDTFWSYSVPVRATRPVAAVAVQVSADAGQTEIRHILLRGRDGTVLREWSWAGPDGGGTPEFTAGEGADDPEDQGPAFEMAGDRER